MRTENYNESEEYTDLAYEVIKEQNTLYWILATGARIICIESSRDKKSDGKIVFGECIKVEEVYQVFCPYDFIIVIYAPNVHHMSKEQKKILIYHELLHCDFNETKKGLRFKTKPHDIEDFREIIDKYGLDWAR